MTTTESDAPTVVAVLGAGVMGSGITRVFARAGHTVRVYDPADGVAASVAAAAEADGLDVTAHDTVADAVRDATFILEAALEDLAVKHALFTEIEAANDSAPIATNTSSLDIDALAPGLRRPDRLVIAHFFNPADVVPLVEVVPGPSTPPATLDIVTRMLRDAGKVAVPLARAVPGFVANRLQAALYREAMALVAEGVASADEVDACVTAGLGPRWALAGPFEIMDLGGLDVWRRVCDGLFPGLDTRTDAPPMLREREAAGHLGAKSGEGFLPRSSDDSARFAERLTALLAARNHVVRQSPAAQDASG